MPVVLDDGGEVYITALGADHKEIGGVVIRQKSQFGEVLAQIAGLPYEQKNVYKISRLPPNVKVATSPNDAQRWQPSHEDLASLPAIAQAREDSSCLVRMITAICGVLNLRPLKMHFYDGETEKLVGLRPFKLGGGCCCPFKTTLVKPGDETQIVGVVEENFTPYCSKCIASSCTCIYYTDIKEPTAGGALETKYTMRLGMACFGAHNNCCGASCCKNDLVYDILDRNGTVVANVQKTYAAGGKGCDTGCCRMFGMFSNYIVGFPPQATPRQRMLIIAAVLHNDYLFFEKKGNDNNGE